MADMSRLTKENSGPQLCHQRSSSWSELRATEEPRFSSPVDYLRASVCFLNKEADSDRGGDSGDGSDEEGETYDYVDPQEVFGGLSSSVLNLGCRASYRQSQSLDEGSPASTPPQSPRSPGPGSHHSKPTRTPRDRELSGHSTGDDNKRYVTMLPAIMDRIKNSPKVDNMQGDSAAAFILCKISQNHLVCNVCNKHFTAPKTLPCLHSFCTACLDRQHRGGPQHDPERDITCPICRETTALPGGTVEGLRDGAHLTALMDDVIELWRRLNDTGKKETLGRPRMHSGNNAREGLKLLDELQDAPSTEKAEETPAEQRQSGGGTAERCETPCCDHPGAENSYFCKTCQTIICKDCSNKHQASKHEYVVAKPAVAMCRNMLQSVMPMVQQEQDDFTKAAASSANDFRRLHITLRRTKEDISAREESDVTRVRKYARRLRDRVEEIGTERAGKIQEAFSRYKKKALVARCMVDTIQSALTTASDVELLQQKQQMFEGIMVLMRDKDMAPTHDLSYLALKRQPLPALRQSDQGQFLLREKWTWECDIGPAPGCCFKQVGYVAVYSNGDLALIDMECFKLTLAYRKGPNGHAKQPRGDFRRMLVRPYTLAINSADELIVVDNSVVKVFDSEMKFLYTISTPFLGFSDKGNVPGAISCLAVDSRDRIAVGNCGKDAISLHRHDGYGIRTIPAAMIDTQMVINQEEQFIYSNYDRRRLICMDYYGQTVFSIDTKERKPTGVCCDREGYIYAAMHTSATGKCEIHQYSPDGLPVACIIDSLSNPLGLTFTKEDELLVSDEYFVKAYRRV